MISLISLIDYRSGMTGKRLEKTIRERFPNIEQEVCDSSGSFYKRLCQPNLGRKREIYIVLADTHERLEKLMGLKKVFEGRRLVLILPGNQKKYLSMGHRLLPRYVSCGTESYDELVSVLEKMIDVLNAGERKETMNNNEITN